MKVRLTVLEAGGRDDLVNETALGKSVFVLVSLLELDAEELCKAAFPREVEPFLLQHVDQLVDVAGVLGSDSGVVDVQNNQHVVGVEEAGIVGGLFEAEFLEGLADMVEPKDWGHRESVETLDEAKTGVGALCGTETSGKVDPDRFLQLGLDERRAEVDGDGGPVEDQGEDEEDANGRPSNDGGIGNQVYKSDQVVPVVLPRIRNQGTRSFRVSMAIHVETIEGVSFVSAEISFQSNVGLSSIIQNMACSTIRLNPMHEDHNRLGLSLSWQPLSIV